jgi:hypothetical protein
LVLGGMSKIIAVALLVLSVFLATQAHAQNGPKPVVTLRSIQGAWWSDCQDPAAEFVIEGDEYSGDFSDRYKLDLVRDILVFKQGLIDGHSTNVTHVPLSFRVIEAGPSQLVLRPIPVNPNSVDWRLQSCSSMPPNNSFKPKPLRGSA